MNLDKIIAALRDEVLSQQNFQVQPISMSVTRISMNQYEPIDATIRVNFAPLFIRVKDENKG